METIKYGWWGKYVDGGTKMKYVGPMSKERMREYYPDYRHNFASKKPKAMLVKASKAVLKAVSSV